MSDAAITSIVAGAVTIATMYFGYLKLKYDMKTAAVGVADKAAVVEKKIDDNTKISTEAKDAAVTTQQQTNGHISEHHSQIAGLLETVTDHHGRILAIENRITSLQSSVDTVTRSVDSAREEIRSHLQTITSKLDLMSATTQVIVQKDHE